MTDPRRIALRPLARILDARQKGENPDAIERENLRLRHEQQRDRLRQKAEYTLSLHDALPKIGRASCRERVYAVIFGRHQCV